MGESVRLLKCANCGVEVHADCYGIDADVDGDIGWRCDVCFVHLKYYKTLLLDHEDECDDILQIFEDANIECLVCPRRGGAFKKMMECERGSAWIHVCCGQWCQGMTFDKEKNTFIKIMKENDEWGNGNQCYLCNKKQNAMDFTIKCQFAGCDKSFHAVCGLFGDCYL